MVLVGKPPEPALGSHEALSPVGISDLATLKPKP